MPLYNLQHHIVGHEGLSILHLRFRQSHAFPRPFPQSSLSHSCSMRGTCIKIEGKLEFFLFGIRSGLVTLKSSFVCSIALGLICITPSETLYALLSKSMTVAALARLTLVDLIGAGPLTATSKAASSLSLSFPSSPSSSDSTSPLFPSVNSGCSSWLLSMVSMHLVGSLEHPLYAPHHHHDIIHHLNPPHFSLLHPLHRRIAWWA